VKLKAEFADAGAAEAAVLALKSDGATPDQIELFSSRPLEFKRGVLDRPSSMSLFAVVGAILNGSLATAFMYYTQLDYPLVTGGMPLTSGWATGVITFELTMLGGVAGTVVALLREGRFFRQSKDAPEQMREDTVYMLVERAENSAQRTQEIVQQNGGRIVVDWGAIS
jgi:Alternative complex III, ActD subunit